VFARKVLFPDGDGAIPEEARTVDELFLSSQNPPQNVISVYKHGWLPFSGNYYIDMEVCDFTLHDYYINGDIQGLQVEWGDGVPLNLQGKCGPYDIMRITKDIASGLKFIHDHQMVHRDLKPANSKVAIGDCANHI
jgi:serine/threonine protein kinase